MDDMISQLPDDVLISIILSIPTKEALRTSILSRRWRNLTRFLPAFDFSCGCPFVCTCTSKAIINGVHGFLQRHYASILSFKLCCCPAGSHSHDTFEQCISSLGKLGIEKLFLKLSWNPLVPDFSFSCHLLSQMPSLKYFTLRYCSLQPNLQYSCNSLKMLKLSRVKGPPGSLECILSNCSSLCSLTLKRRLVNQLPHLKTLLLGDIEDFFQGGSIDMGINMFKFDNLKRLDLAMSNVYIFNLFDLTPLLHSCPLLEEFHLSADAERYNWVDEGKHVVFHSHSHLKNVELSEFSGTKEEIAFASYILKSAVILWLMNISWYCSWYAGFGEWEVVAAPRSRDGGEFSEIVESIQQLEHQAVSKAAQVIFHQFPQKVPKQF